MLSLVLLLFSATPLIIFCLYVFIQFILYVTILLLSAENLRLYEDWKKKSMLSNGLKAHLKLWKINSSRLLQIHVTFIFIFLNEDVLGNGLVKSATE